MFLGSWSASSRRTFIAVGVAVMLSAASGLKAQQAAAPAAPPDPLKLTGEFVVLVNQVKAEKAADFESAWATIKDKLTKSDNPELKAQGEGMKIYKVDLPAATTPGAAVVYLFLLNPPSKTQSYDPTQILFFSKAFERAEADAIYAKIKDAYMSINPWPLAKVGN